MKKLNKFLLLLICMMISCGSVFAGSQRMRSIDYQAYIKSNGDVDVVESWHIWVEGTNTLFKTFEIDSSKYTEITNVKVREISDNGQAKDFRNVGEWQYTVEKDGYYGEIYEGNFEIGWYAGLGNSSDTRKYEISYTIKDGIKKGADCAEFYWQFIGDDNAVFVEEITGTVYLPQKVENKDKIKVWGHSDNLNGEIHAIALDKVGFEGWNLKTNKMFEIRVLFPTEMISQNCKRHVKAKLLEDAVREETEWAEVANQRREEAKKKEEEEEKRRAEEEREMRRILAIIAFIPTLGSGITLFKAISRNRRIYREAKKKYVPSQEIEYYREFPREHASPIEANALVKNSFDKLASGEFGNLFSSILLSLQLKGAIEIKEEGWDTEIVIKAGVNPHLDRMERDVKYFLDSVEKKYGKITTKTIEKYMKKEYRSALSLKDDFTSNAKSALRTANLYDGMKAEEAELKNGCMYAVFGFSWIYIFPIVFGFSIAGDGGMGMMGIILLALIAGYIYEPYSRKKAKKAISPLSQNGLDEQEKWRAFKKFMEEYTLLHEREVQEVVIWEKYLVYATAFGTAKTVLKQLKINMPEVYDSLENMNSPALRMGSYNFDNAFTDGLLKATRAYHAAIAATSSSSDYSSSYSSGGGGGGGFSGGGGGRRWPEAAWAVVN